MTGFITSAKLIALMGLSSVLGYTTTGLGLSAVGVSRPASSFVLSPDRLSGILYTRHQRSQAQAPTAAPSPPAFAVIKKKSYSYDLGLGKNKPLLSSAASTFYEQPQTAQEATRYLVEHESVRPYPAPQLPPTIIAGEQQQQQQVLKSTTVSDKQALATTTSSKNDGDTQKICLPRVELKRKAQDILHIWEDSNNNSNNSAQQQDVSSSNMIGSASPNHKMDLNTVWVEMMIFHEQSKVRVALAAAAAAN
jgi:hypothetical protein